MLHVYALLVRNVCLAIHLLLVGNQLNSLPGLNSTLSSEPDKFHITVVFYIAW